MPIVQLHQLPGSKRAGELVRVLQQLVGDGRRVVVWMADDGRRQMLDDYLWTFDKGSFIAHELWSREQGEVDVPVALVGEPANPNRADVLVVGDELPDDAWAVTFDEVHDFIPAGDTDREQWWQHHVPDGGAPA